MKMVIQFDLDADIVEVPDFIVENRELMKRRFWKWLSNKSVKHKYWVTAVDGAGIEFTGLRFRGDAFVEWLNKKVLEKGDQKAHIVEEHILHYPKDMPSIFF